MPVVKFIFCTLLLMVGFSCKKAPSDASIIRMALLKGPSAIAFSGLLDSVYSVQGKKFETTLYDSPAKVQAMMMQKKVDVAVLPVSTAANLYNKDVDYFFLACPVWGNLFWISSRTGSVRKRASVSLFGRGTTPDILLKYLQATPALSEVSDYVPDYTFSTPQDLLQALLSKQVTDIILPEPFVSLALKKDTALFVRYDLAKEFDPSGFPQTAVVINSRIKQDKSLLSAIDSLLASSIKVSDPGNPETASRLIRHKLLPPGIDLKTLYDRCCIEYRSMSLVKAPADSLLRIFFRYYPKSVGEKLPDEKFYVSGNFL